MDERPRKLMLNFGERVELYNFIKTVGKVSGVHFEYNQGWDDAKVAQKHNVTINNVMTVRKELGTLRGGNPQVMKMAQLEHRVLYLETKVAELSRIVQNSTLSVQK